MDDYEDILSEQEEEQLAEALADEHQAELEVQLERDEEPPQIDEPPETRKLKRELEREALLRIENAARTTDDFKKGRKARRRDNSLRCKRCPDKANPQGRLY